MRVSTRDRLEYLDRIKPYNEVIQLLLNHEADLLSEIKEDSIMSGHLRLALVEDMITLSTHYILLSNVSLAMIKQRNENALNDARKSYIRAIIYMEELVSPMVDVPYSEYEGKLAEIADVNAIRRYLIARKLGLTLELLQNACGINTKWKWAFVELEGRYAAVAKNILDLKNASANRDPRSPDYEPSILHLRLIKKLLNKTASRYRDRFELSTKNPDDLKEALRFLGSLRRIHIVLSEPKEADAIKKKFDSMSLKLDAVVRKKKEESKT